VAWPCQTMSDNRPRRHLRLNDLLVNLRGDLYDQWEAWPQYATATAGSGQITRARAAPAGARSGEHTHPSNPEDLGTTSMRTATTSGAWPLPRMRTETGSCWAATATSVCSSSGAREPSRPRQLAAERRCGRPKGRPHPSGPFSLRAPPRDSGGRHRWARLDEAAYVDRQ
jgi:hypothetical protein